MDTDVVLAGTGRRDRLRAQRRPDAQAFESAPQAPPPTHSAPSRRRPSAAPVLTESARPSESAVAFGAVLNFRAGLSYGRTAWDDTASVGNMRPDLCDALRDLEGAKDDAREEGFPEPSDTAVENARRLLPAMHRLLPRRFEAYPLPDGEVAIDVPGGPGRSILLLCESDGGALCPVNMKGAHRRARYANARALPDGFVRDALAEPERPAHASA